MYRIVSYRKDNGQIAEIYDNGYATEEDAYEDVKWFEQVDRIEQEDFYYYVIEEEK